MIQDKDTTICMLIIALNALSNEAVAYVRDKTSDGRHLIAAANKAAAIVSDTAMKLHGEFVQ